MKAIDEAAASLASAQYGLISRRQLYEAGASRSVCDRRLATGRWQPTSYSSVYVLPGYPRSWQQRLMGAVLAGPPGTAASHRAAAVLLGVREGTPVEVTVPRGANRLGPAAVHQGAIAPVDRGVASGIPVTRVERTLVDLAGVVADDEVERAVEAALRQGLTNPERLRGRLDGLTAPGRRGVSRLRRVLDSRVTGRPAGSELEVRMIQLLRAAGLGDPVRQHEVRVGGNRYFLDLAYPDRRLAIELDGYAHHRGGEAFQHDRARQNALVLAGWTVIRFTWQDVVERRDQVITLVTQVLAA